MEKETTNDFVSIFDFSQFLNMPEEEKNSIFQNTLDLMKQSKVNLSSKKEENYFLFEKKRKTIKILN